MYNKNIYDFKGGMFSVINKDKIVRFDVKAKSGDLIISTDTFDFPIDFFDTKNTDFVVLKGKEIEIADIGQAVDVIVYYKNGDRYKYNTVLDLATDMQVNVHLGSDFVMMEERRGSFKTATDSDAYVEEIIRDDEEPVIFDTPLKIKIKNINIGGIFMESDYPFKIHDIMSLSFIDGKLRTATEILRKQFDKKGNLTGYGCKFMELNLSEEAIVSRFIFDCQIAEREKQKRLSDF